MTIRRQFFERIKALPRSLITSKHFALNRPRSHEGEMLPLSTAASSAFTRADHSWSMNQGGGRDVEHTRSNLG